MNIVIFEDQFAGQLHPINTGRPTYAVTIASFRLIDWLDKLPGRHVGWVRPYLEELQQADFPKIDCRIDDSRDWSLLVNARIVPSKKNFDVLEEMSKRQAPCVIETEDEVQAALIPTSHLPSYCDSCSTERIRRWTGNIDPPTRKLTSTIDTFRHPHQPVQYQLDIIQDSLQQRLKTGNYRQLQDGLFVESGVQLPADYVVDCNDGPILIDQNAKIGPYCFMAGPVYIGKNAKVIEHSAIKDAVSLGHTTKIGGEVEASIIEPYTNKQHHGFLGHSYLGSWINLGAGTCNSDLKNTYGKINIHYGETKIATGMQFLGCFIGDYSKTAINTSIFTGKVIGVCSMMYGFVTSNVPSYVNYARLFGQTSLLPADVMINTQRRMFDRRNVEQRECDKQLIRDMYDLSVDERASVDQDLL